jgi:glycosyltransferase involved in cell wall biosynthesis
MRHYSSRPLRVLLDGRIDARDGIGRYTRCTIAALRRLAPEDVELMVLPPTGVSRYSCAEDEELHDYLRVHRVDVVHLLNYRMPTLPLPVPVVVTVHDSAHLRAPELCFTDEEFDRWFGPATFEWLRRVTTALEWSAGQPAPDLSWHARYFRAMLRHALDTAADVIVPTTVLAGDLQAFVPAARTAVSPWGVDHLPRPPAGPAAGVGALPAGLASGRFLLFVSVARRYKGLAELGAAYRAGSARRAGARLVLAGGRCGLGGQAATVLAAAGVTDAVLLGDVDDSTLVGLYRSAAALVHPARFESFGFPPVEALSQGCPVVVNDLPALREVLGRHGRFVAADDTAALAAAMDAAVADPPARADVTAGVRHAGRYRWRRHGTDLLDRYRDAAG